MRLAFDIGESVRIALSAIVANRSRGALTSLGIIIGIMSVITTMTAANGLRNTFKESFASVGTDVIYVSRMPWVELSSGFAYRNRRKISLDSSEYLARRTQGRAIVAPSISAELDVKSRAAEISDAIVIGTTDKQALISDLVPERGRFLMPFDGHFKLNVAVIGAGVADGLFPNADPLGREFMIGRSLFRVIGVMEQQGSSLFDGPDYDRQIYVPITTFGKAFGFEDGQADVDVAVKMLTNQPLDDFEYEIVGAMRTFRNLAPGDENDFTINKLDSIMEVYNTTMGVVVLLGMVITGISLFVGGVGVMNIMFVSVTERTREIGIRKAIGAKRRSIVMQFLFESTAICLFGGVIGALLAGLVTVLIDALLMPASLSPQILLAAPVIAIAVGVLSGLVPAYRGANLNPIEALRYE